MLLYLSLRMKVCFSEIEVHNRRRISKLEYPNPILPPNPQESMSAAIGFQPLPVDLTSVYSPLTQAYQLQSGPLHWPVSAAVRIVARQQYLKSTLFAVGIRSYL